jgi:hypothetical protein
MVAIGIDKVSITVVYSPQRLGTQELQDRSTTVNNQPNNQQPVTNTQTVSLATAEQILRNEASSLLIWAGLTKSPSTRLECMAQREALLERAAVLAHLPQITQSVVGAMIAHAITIQ